MVILAKTAILVILASHMASHFRTRVDGGRAEKMFHLGSCLHQRDRATSEFSGVYTHWKPGNIFYWRGCAPSDVPGDARAQRPKTPFRRSTVLGSAHPPQHHRATSPCSGYRPRLFAIRVSRTPQDFGPFFRRNFFSAWDRRHWTKKRGLLTTTRSQPRLGLVEGSRGPTQTHIRGLCHWPLGR